MPRSKLDVESATLREARRHIQHQLRVLQAEERALLAWRPGEQMPTPAEVVPVSPAANEEADDEAWTEAEGFAADGTAAEADAAADDMELSQRSSGSTRQHTAAGQWRMEADGGAQAAAGPSAEAAASWDGLMGELEDDSPWVSVQPPSVLSGSGVGMNVREPSDNT